MPLPDLQPRPLVAITTDLIERNTRPTAICTMAYAHCVTQAGGLPVLTLPIPELAKAAARRFDAFIFSGGDDPVTEPFAVPTHPKAIPIHPDRQAFETALLLELRDHFPDKPVLGVCLGLQLMALIAGAHLDQHLPDSCPSADRHWDAQHPIVPEPTCAWLSPGLVHSRHKQAITNPGSLTIAARSDDALIEALEDPARRFYRAVQWHPERTDTPELGQSLFNDLVSAC